ncbi:hypothetical protein LCGC14_0982180 [marine sediment metagenome]|uniref:Uncharacterized protein n=1 Tax=marine sediment metagenome TaxID=412755 RepID=A0A0F9QRR0_9ZZZZ
MSNQPPQGAKQYTAAEAAEIVKRVQAGLPLEGTQVPTVVTSTVTSETQAVLDAQKSNGGAKKEEPAPEPADFAVINPPLGVFRPRRIGDSIRGYLLAVQVDALSGAAFYVVQLTELCDDIEWYNEGDAQVGDDVAIYDAPTLKAMRSLMPQYDQAGNCIAATEIIAEPRRHNSLFVWDYLLQARRVLKPGASRPAFAGVPDIPPYGEIVDAAGNSSVSDVWRRGVDESGD